MVTVEFKQRSKRRIKVAKEKTVNGVKHCMCTDKRKEYELSVLPLNAQAHVCRIVVKRRVIERAVEEER